LRLRLPRICHNRVTPHSPPPCIICRPYAEEVIRIHDLRKWIVGLVAVALVAAGVVVLAGNGFGRGNAASTGSCPAATAGSLCDQDDDGDGILNSEDPDWICPADESGCGGGAGYCQGLSADRPLDGTGSAGSCGRGIGQGFGGCRGGRF
jgi:hypothetical protein